MSVSAWPKRSLTVGFPSGEAMNCSNVSVRSLRRGAAMSAGSVDMVEAEWVRYCLRLKAFHRELYSARVR